MAVVVTSVKFLDGAWFVVLLIPVLVSMMLFIRREYDGQERELHVREDLVVEGPHREQRVVIPVNGINRAVIQAVNFGRTLSPTSGRSSSPRTPRMATPSGSAGSARSPACPWSSSSRRIGR